MISRTYNLQVVTNGNDVGFRPYWAHAPPMTAVTEQVILAAFILSIYTATLQSLVLAFLKQSPMEPHTPEYRVPTPKTYHPPTSRDDRLRIRTLYYDAGWSINDLLLQLPFTQHQLYYALKTRPTPQKHTTDRHPTLDTPYRKSLVAWATTSSQNRDVPWAELPKNLGWHCSSFAIRTAFKKEGYVRGVRRKVPLLSEKNHDARLT
jgi:hypothetical protein